MVGAPIFKYRPIYPFIGACSMHLLPHFWQSNVLRVIFELGHCGDWRLPMLFQSAVDHLLHLLGNSIK